MTIESEDLVFSYTGNGVTTEFAMADCIVYNEAHVVVKVDGTIISTGYTVSDIGEDTGAIVTFTTAPASGAAIILYREVPYVQESDLENYDGTPAEVVERQFDLLVMMAQQLNDSADRAIRFPVGETYSAELPSLELSAGKYLFRNLDGTIGAADGTTDTPISSAMTPVVSATSLTAAQIALGLGNLAVESTVKFDALDDTLVADLADLEAATVGTVPTADAVNSYFNSYFNTLSYGTFLYNDAAQAIANATETAITFNTEGYDDGSWHNNSTNTSRITFNFTGRVHIVGRIWYASTAAASFAAIIKKNGATYAQNYATYGSSTNLNRSVEIDCYVKVSPNDYIELFASQNTGGSVNTVQGSAATTLFAQRVK